MSHANAEVVYKDEVIGYTEYNGTSDVMAWNSWYETPEEVSENWRSTTRKWLKPCSCDRVDVKLYADYGGGFYWDGQVCLEHCIIVDGILPYNENKIPYYGHPIKGHNK